MKALKILGAVILFLLILLAGLSLVASSFIDQGKYKDLITAKVKDATGYTITWDGDIKLGFLPTPHVTLNKVVAKADTITIATAEQLHVSVALAGLTSGNIAINSVDLDQPVINLLVDKQGRQTWMTETLSKSDEQAPETDAAPETSPEKAETRHLSVGPITITNGALTYQDDTAGNKTMVEKLNARVTSDFGAGPFEVDGKGILSTQSGKEPSSLDKIAFDIKAQTGKPNEEGGLPLQAEIKLPDDGLSGEYSGVIKTSGPFMTEGDLSVTIPDLKKFLQSIQTKSSDLPDDLSGPAGIQAILSVTPDVVSLRNAKLTVAGVSYLGAFAAEGLKTAETPTIRIDMAPEKKGGEEAGSNPTPLRAALKNLKITGAGQMVDKAIIINQATVTLDGTPVNISVRYDPPASADARALVTANISATRLDLDDLMRDVTGKAPTATQDKPANAEESAAEVASQIKGISLPVDLVAKVKVDELITGGKNFAPMNGDFALRGDGLRINQAQIGLGGQGTVALSGSVASLSALSGIDMTVGVNTADADALLKSLKISQTAIKQPIGPGRVNANLKGSGEAVQFDATASALQFAVTGRGTVQSPLSKPVINNVDLRITHPNAVTALKTFRPNTDPGPTFQGPLDIASAVTWDKNRYHAGALKGKIGSTTLNGDIYLDLSGAKPDVTGQINLGNLVLAAATPNNSQGPDQGAGNAASTQKAGEARWSRQAIDTSWMNAATADLQIKAESIAYDYWKFVQPGLSVKLNAGTLTISDAQSGLFGGNASLDAKVKSGATERDPLSITTALKISNVDARQLHAALVSKQSDFITGTINGADITVSANGVSPAALVYSLTGNGQMNGKNLVVKGIDAAQLAMTAQGSYKPLERAGSLVSTFRDGQTEFTDFSMKFDIQNGVIRLNPILFDGTKARIDGSGTVSLPQWYVDVKNSITVKNTDIPPFDIVVRGPLDNPGQTGGGVLENYLRAKFGKQVEDKLKKLIGKKLGLPQQEAAPAPAVPVDGAAAPAETAPAAEPTPEQSLEKVLSDPKKAKPEDIMRGLGGLLAR